MNILLVPITPVNRHFATSAPSNEKPTSEALCCTSDVGYLLIYKAFTKNYQAPNALNIS